MLMEMRWLILSARIELWDKVKGFRLGCDDYVVKPFTRTVDVYVSASTRSSTDRDVKLRQFTKLGTD
jgi:DNA-binding response OmpR family regulator